MTDMGGGPVPSRTLRWTVLVLLPVVVLALAALVASTLRAYAPPLPPDQIRLSLRGDPHTTMAVVWHAATAAPGTVKVRGDAGMQTFPGRRTDGTPTGSGIWRQADLTGLRPGSTYRYVVTSGDAESGEFEFRTKPLGVHPVRFDVFGDQGDCTHFAPACRVMDGIAADRPNFVLGAGDLTYANDNGPEAADLWANDVMRRYGTWAPLMPTLGNHEYLEGDSIDNYKGRFALPDQGGTSAPDSARGDYYSFDYGPVHVVALPERYVDMKANSDFRRWLEDDLRTACANPAIQWRIAFNHRPFYSTGRRHGPDQTYQKWVAPILEQYHVDLVFSGHEHVYERSLPMNGGTPVTRRANKWRQGAGTAYVVTGGGGAPSYNDFGPAAAWDAVRETGHHHVRVDIDVDGTLRLTAISDDDGQRPIDEVIIERTGRTADCR